MKHTLTVLFALILCAGLALAETIDVKVKGMVCSFCAQGLDKKFRAEPAVDDVKVTLKEKNIRLKLKENGKMSDETIDKLVKDAGYNVQSIQRN